MKNLILLKLKEWFNVRAWYHTIVKVAHDGVHRKCDSYKDGCPEHPTGHYIPALILFSFIVTVVVPRVGGYFLDKGFGSDSPTKNVSSLDVSATPLFWKSDFQDELFSYVGLEGKTMVVKNQMVSISSGVKNKLLRFSKVIPQDSIIEFSFVPWSGEEVNTVLVIHDLYELVVGNGDYRTVTVQDQKTGDLIFNNSNDSKKNEREVQWGFKKGARISLFITQEYLSDESRYRIHLDIKYFPEFGDVSNPEHITGTYFIEPGNDYNGEDLNLSVGLINPNNKDEIRSSMEYFEVSRK